MSNALSVQRRDVVVIGAGPAGLSAARTLARLGFDTLVVERESSAGELAHPCYAIITPPPGLDDDRLVTGGLQFPQIDLIIPSSLISARAPAFRCLAPDGSAFPIPAGADTPAPVMIDKSGLLRLLARQAQHAGAEFLWGTPVTSLINNGDAVVGVRTPAGDVEAPIVIQAGGVAAPTCGMPWDGSRTEPVLHLLVLSQDLEAPRVGPSQTGCTLTLGRAFSSAPAGFGTFLVPGPGRATMMFTMPVTELDCGLVSDAWGFLAEYANDPRIAGFLDGARVLRRASFLQPFGRAPESAVRDGLMLAGNAAAPSAWLGILPSMYVGRQAALVAAGALEAGDTSAATLAPYDQFLKALVLPGLASESLVLERLLHMSDAELNRLVPLLTALGLPLPGFTAVPSITAETIAWLGRHLDLSASDHDLLARLLAGDASVAEATISLPAYIDSL